MAVWRCAICLVFISLTLRLLLSHINLSHAGMPNFRVVCGINDCPMVYTRYHSFYKHVRNSHSDLYDIDAPNPTALELDLQDGDDGNDMNDDGSDGGQDLPFGNMDNEVESDQNDDGSDGGQDLPFGNMDNEVESDQNDDEDIGEMGEAVPDNPNRLDEFGIPDRKTQAGYFLLGTKARNGLTQAAVDDIMDGSRRLVDYSLKKFSAQLLNNLQNAMDDTEQIDFHEVERMVSSTLDDNNDLFDGVDTAYLQKKFLKNLDFIAPKEVVLGERAVQKLKGDKCVVLAKEDCFYYIPFIDNIKNWLANERVQNMVLSPTNCDHQGFLVDLCCGEIYKQHYLFKNGDTIPVILYYDEIDVCNPIGTRASIHKLGMFYFSLGTIDLKYRSRLSSIRLLCITSSENINRYGVDKILQPFYNDLVTFSDGVPLSLADGRDILFKCALIAAVADTPASHQLGGFKEGVGGAYAKCRHCNCTVDDMQEHFGYTDFNSRNLLTHLQQCDEINNAATTYMRNHLRTTFGINRRSVLVDFPHFDVTKMLPQDIMHVMYEGVMQHELKQILKYLIENRIFDLDVFNLKLKNFKYPYFDRKDKPCPIQRVVLTSDDSRLKQTASQMVVLIKILPFLLMGLVPPDNMYYKSVVELLKIFHILVSPVISCATLCLLKELISEHLTSFKQLFPDLNILPKQHYMIHFPKLIKHFGPPIRYSCMRFEAKHQYFKRAATKQNFLNLSKSLATQYQQQECLSQINDNPEYHPLFDSQLGVGPAKVLSATELAHIKRQITVYGHDDGTFELISGYSMRHVTVCGTRYLIDQSYLLLKSSDGLPEFGLLKKCYVVNSTEVFFELEMLETIMFEVELQAYVVEKTDLAQGYKFCAQHKLIDHTCYGIITEGNMSYIPIEFDLGDLIDLNNLN